MKTPRLTSLIVASMLFAGSAVLAEEAAAPAPAVEEVATPAPPKMETEDQKISYVIGVQIASDLAGLKEIGVTMDVELLLRGLRDGLKGETHVNDAQIEEAMNLLRTKAMTHQMQQQMAQQQAMGDSPMAAEQLAASNDFLAANALNEDITVTASGLQYRVIKSGEGKTPGPNSQVVAHYTGTLIDGTKFDSSVDRGQPFRFSTAGGVIDGWIEAARMMKEGDKWQIFLPPNLAYGARGSMPTIPPNSALIFELELIEVID
jgi:FKBP-type peptidyl-prolyl cis-trans isomerase FklB